MARSGKDGKNRSRSRNQQRIAKEVRREVGGKEQNFVEHFWSGATGGGHQDAPRESQRPVDDPYAGAEEGGSEKRPRNAPSSGPKVKANQPLGSYLEPEGTGARQFMRNNPRDPQHVLEGVQEMAAEYDRMLVDQVSDPDERHMLAADWAVKTFQANKRNINMQAVSVAAVARQIDNPKVSKLTDEETKLAYPKKDRAVAKSLKEKEGKKMKAFQSSTKPGASDMRTLAPTVRERREPSRRIRGSETHGVQNPLPGATPRGSPAKAKLGSKGQDTGGAQSEGRGAGIPIHNPPHGEITKGRTSKEKTLKAGDTVKKGKLSPQQYFYNVSPDEEKWINEQMQYGGLFHGAKGNKVPGAYRRYQRYTNARQQGYENRDNISDWLRSDTRGRKPSITNPNRANKAKTDQELKERYTGGVTRKKGTQKKDRYQSGIPSHEDFGVGIRVPGIPSESQLKEENPDMTDRQIFELHESFKQSVEEMQENQRMSHETRQNTLLGRDKSESAAGKEDRVVFFTTSTGSPAISVGANSLLGQYIIKKRKKMIYDQRMAPRAELKGEFPYAVRDQHLIEVATGLTLGAQGRYGAFRHVGYRVNAKKSKGYGKMLPVGSQILRDSSGQPLYDRNGNLRYSEGFTRPFDIRPSNEVGLRVYIG